MLKRFAAISFLFLLLFNAFGYYLLFGYEQKQARQEVVESVKNMPNSAFKVIKLPVSAYVHIEDRDFEYTEGVTNDIENITELSIETFGELLNTRFA